MSEIVLTTNRLELRQIGPDDLELHLEYLNSPAVMERLGGPRTRSQLAIKHEKSRDGFERDRFGFMFAFEKASGELVAHCGMKRVDNIHAPNIGDHEIGWLVREDRWRIGYAEEAVRAIIDWAFETHDAPFLVALTSEANIGSWKLMEKLGMARRRDLDFSDPSFSEEDNPTIQYSLTRQQWENDRCTAPA